MNIPPIALFTYNRPEKTKQVLQAIKYQGVERIYVYCDGARNDEEDRLLVQKNIEIVKAFPFEDKKVIVAEKNKGLANSIIDGITNTFKFEKELIILEDDCLPFDQMLNFMSENLANWSKHKDIFSISAYHFIPSDYKIDIPYDIFLTNRFLPWGWATWKDRWEVILAELKNKTNPYGTYKKIPDIAGRDLLYHSYAVEKKMVDSWAIPLGLLTLYKGYRHVMPTQPLVNNTGMDDSGTNTGSKHNRIVPVLHSPQFSFPLNMCPYSFHDEKLEELFIDSLDVMLPPDWLKKKINAELKTNNNCKIVD